MEWMEKINKVWHGDCYKLLESMPDKCVDIVVTDPPYGMSFVSNHRKTKHKKIVGDKEFPVGVIDELIRVSRKAVYVFCRWDNLKDLPKPKSVIAWVKNNWSMGDLKHEHGRQWEAICFYPQLQHEFIKRIPDVITNSRTGNDLHPTQKPVDLIKTLIQANKGDLVFDPFMGSWTTAVACQQLGRNFIGAEIDKEYCEIGRQRLRQQVLL
jgi:site-specific DNA-methyltransferase (adenine-specific)